MVSEDLIKEFRQAINEDYGKEVGLIEAGQILTDLVDFYDKLAEVHHRDIVKESDIIESNK